MRTAAARSAILPPSRVPATPPARKQVSATPARLREVCKQRIQYSSMKVFSPKNAADRSTSSTVRTANEPHRSPRPAAPGEADGRGAEQAGGGHAQRDQGRGGQRAPEEPTLPPAAKMLMAAALFPASWRAALPAAGWNMATPSPEARIAHHTAP